ncbi:MAG: DUF1315 family protein [Pseudomonas sp.]
MTDRPDNDDRPDSMQALMDRVTPEMYVSLKAAVETGRWANGERLTQEQVENTLQLIIGWELQNLPEHERTGYIDTTGLKQSHCDTPDHEHGHDHHREVPVSWVDNGNHTTH